MPRVVKIIVLAMCIALGASLVPVSSAAQSDLRNLRSGIWQGAVRGNAEGVVTSCYLSTFKENRKTRILLIWNDLGLHIGLYNKNWSLTKGDTFRARVRIDGKFDDLVDATVRSSNLIDYVFGLDEPSIESVQAGNRITLESPVGKKTFKLRGTRKAINVLLDCADKYIFPASDAPSNQSSGSGATNIKSPVTTQPVTQAVTQPVTQADTQADTQDDTQAVTQADTQGGAVVLDNWNKGGCGLTDKIGFTMASRIAIDQFSTWINWPSGVTSTGYTVRKDGYAVYQGTLKRGSCDSNQTSWCQGTDSWKLLLFDPGTYEITTDIARVCQNAASDGNGYIQLQAAGDQGGGAAIASDPKPGASLSDGGNAVNRAVSGPNSILAMGDFTADGGRLILHPGDEIDVAFTAQSGLHERSWIGIVSDDAQPDPTPFHAGATDLKERTEGVVTVTVPRTLGDFRLWMYDAWNRKRLTGLAIRIEVDRDSAALEMPGTNRLKPGQEFDVLFRASPNYSYYAWIAIVGADTPRNISQGDISDLNGRVYLKNQIDGRLTFSAPMRPGHYLLRMQEEEFKETLRELELVVEDPAEAADREPGVTPASPESTLDDIKARAGQNDPAAMVAYALTLLEGDVVPTDPLLARQLVEAAAATGYAPAQFLLSLLLEKGIGGPADTDKARDYLNAAADASLSDALFRRARLTAKSDPESAMHDLKLAGAQGYVPALQVYTTLRSWNEIGLTFEDNATQDNATQDNAAGGNTTQDSTAQNRAAQNNAPVPAEVAKCDLIAIQAMLNWLGYQAGPPVGDMSPDTAAAIRAFQTMENLPVDGVASTQIRGALIKATERGN